MKISSEESLPRTTVVKASEGLSSKSVAFVPERFALYRHAIVKRLSDYDSNGYLFTVYADPEERLKGLQIVDKRYCDLDHSNGGVRWIKIRNLTLGRKCFWQTGLLRLALCEKYDVVVFWGDAYKASTWLSSIILRIMGRKVVYWTHGLYGNEGFLKKFVRVLFYKLADSILVYGDYAKRLLIDEGFDEDKVWVIKNSLDVQHQTALFERYFGKTSQVKNSFFCRNDRVLIFVGRLEPQKRLELLFRALVELKSSEDVCYKLLLIGDGSDKARLVDLASELGLADDIVFYGRCYDDEEIAPLIMMADICVSPGEVGLTAMHSLVYGTPVVTHGDFAQQMPEFEAIEPNLSGGFFEFNNLKSLCEAITDVIRGIELGSISARSCRDAVIKTYTPDYQLTVFNEMLESLDE